LNVETLLKSWLTLGVDDEAREVGFNDGFQATDHQQANLNYATSLNLTLKHRIPTGSPPRIRIHRGA